MEKSMVREIIKLSLAVFFTATIIVLTQVSFDDVLASTGSGEQTPHYKELKEKIDEFSEEKWDPAAYELLRKTIERYADKKPSPHISEKDRDELIFLLEGRYLISLQSEISSFLAGVEGLKSINHLAEALKPFESKRDRHNIERMESMIESYRVLQKNITQIRVYTASSQYNAGLTKQYNSQIEDFRTAGNPIEEYIRGNKDIQDRIKKAVDRLNTHKAHSIDFYEESLKQSCNCKEQYGGYQFYVDTCVAIQAERDSQ